MNVLILTYGTRGDVQPYIALGQGLQHAGHSVTLSTSERFRSAVEAAGLQYEFMNDGMLALLETPEGQDMLENTNNLFDVVKRTLSLMKQVGPIQQALVEESWNAAQRSCPDFIVFHPKAFIAPSIADKLDVPVAMALVVPGLVPTAEHPNMVLPRMKLGGWYNKLSYRIVNQLIGLSVGKHIRAWRKQNDLPKMNGTSLLYTGDGTPVPVLHGFSRLIFPPPADWPPNVSVCGYWHADDCQSYSPAPELEVFLAAGPPPVYVGFGSMKGRDPARLASTAIEAIQRAGVRGLLATGWGGLEAEALPETILKIDQVPHAWLFPRVRAVVHHGGAGTTGAALRAGKPSVVVPFFGDQPFWGHQVHALGAAAVPIPLKKLTVEKLQAAIQEVTTDQAIIDRADTLGVELREEDGVGNAVAVIESLAASEWPVESDK
jgi:sterol 3beta-glucosyltransferase